MPQREKRRPSAYGLALREALKDQNVTPVARKIAHATTRDEKHVRRYLHKIMSGEIQWPAEWWRNRISQAVRDLGLEADLPSPEAATGDPTLAALWRVQASLDELQDAHNARLDSIEERLAKLEGE